MRATRALTPLLACCLAALVATPLRAEGLASSAASTASSAVSSASNSLGQSSGSLSPAKVAEGDYRIIDRARVAQRPGTLRLRLQPVAGPAEQAFDLWLPEAVAEQASLRTGGTVHARHRDFGLEFAQGEPRRAFFLALNDDWYRDLQTTPVGL